jgi:hypothetical protein
MASDWHQLVWMTTIALLCGIGVKEKNLPPPGSGMVHLFLNT